MPFCRGPYPGVYASFVVVTLSLLLGMHLYSYLTGSASFDGDFNDIKYVVMQLTKGLTDVSRKHDALAHELKNIAHTIHSLPPTTSRDIQDTKTRCCMRRSLDTELADFALESAGAKVLDTGCTVDHVMYESPVGWALHLLSSIMCRACIGAQVMLQPGILPGECWAFKGHKGEATIRLVGSVIITGLSIEHIPAKIAPAKEVPTAPRRFRLEGLEDRRDPHPHDFGTFEFCKDGKPSQYFDVTYPPPKPYNMVKFTVLSNWGHPVYTCVYRLRIHGELAPGHGRIN